MSEFRKHRLFCATWSRFNDRLGARELPQTQRVANALAKHLQSANALDGDAVIATDESATATINALEDFVSTKSDSLIVYIASHGLYPSIRTNSFRLATGDTEQVSDLVRALPVSEVVDRLEACNASQKLLVVDACYAGWPANALMIADEQNADDDLRRPTLAILASSSPREASIAPPGAEYTLFGGHILNILAENHDTDLTMTALYEKARQFSSQANGPQPWFASQGTVGDAVILPAGRETIALTIVEEQQAEFDYRAEILYIEDTEEEIPPFVEELEQAGHTVTVAESPADAYTRLEGSYYDIIVLDFYLAGDEPAIELIRYIGMSVKHSCVILTSRASKAAEAWRSLDKVFAYPNPVDSFVFKADHIAQATLFANEIREERREVLERVSNLEHMVARIAGRILKRDKSTIQLTSAALQLQVRICIQRLVNRWFDPEDPATDYVIAMQMAPLGSGRSSCSVFSLLPMIPGLDAAQISPLILKIGPSREIEEEVRRFYKYVQIGIPLSARTDLIGTTTVGAVAGVIYSFLGDDHESVQEAATLPFLELAECLQTLIGPSGKRWLAAGGTGRGVRPSTYFAEKGWTPERFVDTAEEMQVGLRHAKFERSSIDPFFAERPRVNASKPAALVHEDLHLGNILRYAPGSYAIIDYRDVRIGPRVADFVNLEVACWLLATPPRERRADLITDVVEAASGGLQDQRESYEVPEWLRDSWRLASKCRSLALENFKVEPVTSLEYGSLLWFSAVRRSALRAAATSRPERTAIKCVPHALAIVAQNLVPLSDSP